MAVIWEARGRRVDALRVYKAIWDQFRSEPRRNPVHRAAIKARLNWALLVGKDERGSLEASAAIREVLAEFRLVHGPEHPITLAIETIADELGISHQSLGSADASVACVCD